jgi:Transglutaminase-like superfamily
MSNFRPGVDAARAALGSAVPIVQKPHPGGAKGVKISLQEVAERIQKGRNDPRMVAWARRAINAAGGPQTTVGQAEAILKQLKTETSYVPDPVKTEFMASPAQILCLDDKGLCFRGGDCDELVITFCSATLAVGIPTRVIGEAFARDGGIPSHVLAAIQDSSTGDWLRVDPSTNLPVGKYVPGAKEIWIDPMSPSISGLSDGAGEFVGVGRPLQALGAVTSAATPPANNTAVLWILGLASAAVIALYVSEERRARRR